MMGVQHLYCVMWRLHPIGFFFDWKCALAIGDMLMMNVFTNLSFSDAQIILIISFFQVSVPNTITDDNVCESSKLWKISITWSFMSSVFVFFFLFDDLHAKFLFQIQ